MRAHGAVQPSPKPRPARHAKVIVMGFDVVEIDEVARTQLLAIEESHIAAKR
jgi:hypothetical protein